MNHLKTRKKEIYAYPLGAYSNIKSAYYFNSTLGSRDFGFLINDIFSCPLYTRVLIQFFVKDFLLRQKDPRKTILVVSSKIKSIRLLRTLSELTVQSYIIGKWPSGFITTTFLKQAKLKKKHRLKFLVFLDLNQSRQCLNEAKVANLPVVSLDNFEKTQLRNSMKVEHANVNSFNSLTCAFYQFVQHIRPIIQEFSYTVREAKIKA